MNDPQSPSAASSHPLALVTGASSGIGAIYARRLAERGYDLVVTARRADRIKALAETLRRAHGVAVEPLAADLSEREGLARVEQRIRAADNLRFLVNNAGFGSSAGFYDDAIEEHDRMVRVHVLAVMRLSYAALHVMLPRRAGAIVNVSSVAGFVQSPTGLLYCSTKAWITSFTEGLHLLARDQGVRVQALCPGFTLTEFHDVIEFDRSLIAKKWWMRAEDVVDASLAGVERKRLIVVPGLRYKMIAFLATTMPRALFRWLALRRDRPMTTRTTR